MIHIPKFTVEAKYDLKPILKHLGITEIFDPATANFSKMRKFSIFARKRHIFGKHHVDFSVMVFIYDEIHLCRLTLKY
jgi:serine protease inhibitor